MWPEVEEGDGLAGAGRKRGGGARGCSSGRRRGWVWDLDEASVDGTREDKREGPVWLRIDARG